MAELKDNPKRYRPQQYAYAKEWHAKQPPKPKRVRTYKLTAEVRAKKAAYQREWRARGTNKEKAKETARKSYALNGKHSYGHKTRKALLKATHIRNRELLAARPKPDICDVCGGSQGGIVFDHCHRMNHFRGWLCNGCNRAIGFVNDDPHRLRMLAIYLERTRDGQGAQYNIPGL